MQSVLFFDGICGLCNRFVDFVLKNDRSAKLLFSPLQGEVAKSRLPKDITVNLQTVVYLKEQQVLIKSDAVIEVLSDLGGVFKIAKIFKILPRFARDFVYDLIARQRYFLFGQRETCRIPTAEERARFI